MESLLRFASGPAVATISNIRFNEKTKTKKNGVLLTAKLDDEIDPLLQAAINAACLRFQETRRPEPLFVDPHAGCLVPPNVQMDLKYSHPYCLATKFIDDKLFRTVNHIDGLKQVVLLTDGMNTQPYRLNCPTSTIIFDISPERIFKKSAEKLNELSNRQQALHTKGFNSNGPSIWAVQGLPVITLASFEEILFRVRNLATNGCLFLGELPAWLTETEIRGKSTTEKWMDQLFMSNGFGVGMISYKEVTNSMGKELAPEYCKNILCCRTIVFF